MNTRITHTMVQRNVLADLNAASSRLSKTQSKMASNKEIEKPSDNPYGASQAMALRSSVASTQQYQRNAEDAQGWMEATEQALDEITQVVQRARDLMLGGATSSSDGRSRESIADEIEQIIQSVKQNANATYRGSFIFSGGKTDTQPYEQGAPDNYFGDEAGWQGTDPPIVREIGPGVSLTINTVGREFLGDGPTGNDGKLLDTLRDAVTALRADDGAAVKDTVLPQLDDNIDKLLEVRSRNGARSNRIDSALSRLGEVEDATVKQLSQTEDADIAKTIIDFNSQQAAYQSALRAGAALVQSSLMDFLR